VSEEQRLEQEVAAQVERIKKAARGRDTLLAQSVYIGTLGLLFVLPVVGGAYLGLWLDDRLEGYAVHWTMSLIVLGVVLGAVNVYLYVKE